MIARIFGLVFVASFASTLAAHERGRSGLASWLAARRNVSSTNKYEPDLGTHEEVRMKEEPNLDAIDVGDTSSMENPVVDIEDIANMGNPDEISENLAQLLKQTTEEVDFMEKSLQKQNTKDRNVNSVASKWPALLYAGGAASLSWVASTPTVIPLIVIASIALYNFRHSWNPNIANFIKLFGISALCIAIPVALAYQSNWLSGEPKTALTANDKLMIAVGTMLISASIWTFVKGSDNKRTGQ